MELTLILKGLWRNKTWPLLIGLQLGITMIILSFVTYILINIGTIYLAGSGMDEEHLGRLWMRMADRDANFRDQVNSDMKSIREHKGVIDSAPFGMTPFQPYPAMERLRLDPDAKAAVTVAVLVQSDEHAINTLGAKLLEGRNFSDEEVIYAPDSFNTPARVTIIGKQLAQNLFPGESALGKVIYSESNQPVTVIGIVEDVRTVITAGPLLNNMALVPVVRVRETVDYIVRTESPMTMVFLTELQDKLNQGNQVRTIGDPRELSSIKKENQGMLDLSFTVMSLLFALLIVISALGVVGIASYRIASSRRSIGIRRALGASRAGIIRYYLLENLLLFVFGLGMSIAMVPAFAQMYSEVAPGFFLQWYALPITASSVLLITLAASAWPVWQASQVEPSVAARNIRKAA